VTQPDQVVAEASPRRWNLSALTGRSEMLQQEGYRQLWFARLASHTAINAVLYTLLVLVVQGQGTGASIKSALFITAYILPTATMGTISGVIVDRLPKNLVLAAANIGRLGLMILILMSDMGVWTIYGIALLLAMTSQFAAPAEAAALPQVVAPGQLTKANSMNTFGGLLSQAAGFALLPPLFLNTVGPRPLFFVASVLFGVGAALFFGIQHLGARQIDIDSTVDAVREVRKQFAHAWETLERDVGAYMAVMVFVLASTASLVGATLMPLFTREVLDIPVRNAIFVFLPAAVGVLAGLRLVESLERRVARGWLVGVGFMLLAAAFLGLSLTGTFAGMIEELNLLGLFSPGPFGERAARIGVTIAFSVVAAFAYSVVGVASRSLVNERMPLDIQGRVFAAQVVLTNLASIPPILLAGLLAEGFGVGPVLFLFVLIMVGVGGWTYARAAARPTVGEEAEDFEETEQTEDVEAPGPDGD